MFIKKLVHKKQRKNVCWWLYDKVKIEGYSLIEE